jgi:phage baseplate assembly protein W
MAIYSGPGLPSVDNGFPNIAVDLPLIRNSFETILNTGIGERLFNPSFGSRYRELVFEPNDLILQTLAKIYISDAITTWDNRVQLLVFGFVVDRNTLTSSFVYQVLKLGFTSNGTFALPRLST